MEIVRPSWDEYFGKIALLTARRATCPRKHVGAVFVNSAYRILSTGYNGSLPGEPHCVDVGCDIYQTHCVRVNHAEINGLLGALQSGARLDDATAYVTAFPCWACFKACVAVGVKRFKYIETYRPDPRVEEYRSRHQIDVVQIHVRLEDG